MLAELSRGCAHDNDQRHCGPPIRRERKRSEILQGFYPQVCRRCKPVCLSVQTSMSGTLGTDSRRKSVVRLETLRIVPIAVVFRSCIRVES